jgi:hypothetical protein
MSFLYFLPIRNHRQFLKFSKYSRNASSYISTQRGIRSNRSEWTVDLNTKPPSKASLSKREFKLTSTPTIPQNPTGFLSVSTGRCSTMLFGANMSNKLWAQAISMAIYLKNRLPHPSLRGNVTLTRCGSEPSRRYHIFVFSAALFTFMSLMNVVKSMPMESQPSLYSHVLRRI